MWSGLDASGYLIEKKKELLTPLMLRRVWAVGAGQLGRIVDVVIVYRACCRSNVKVDQPPPHFNHVHKY